MLFGALSAAFCWPPSTLTLPPLPVPLGVAPPPPELFSYPAAKSTPPFPHAPVAGGAHSPCDAPQPTQDPLRRPDGYHDASEGWKESVNPNTASRSLCQTMIPFSPLAAGFGPYPG